MFELGSARRDITAPVEGVGMMGYVKEGNVVAGVETPLHARATVIKAGDAKVAIVCAEICFVTIAIKQGVLERLERDHPELGYHEANVLISATHTHSAPGGYSHYFFYNVSVPGFVPEVWETVIAGITAAIVEADRQAAPGALKLAAGAIPPEREVAFNRSLAAYNANHDVVKRSHEERHLAVDREMTLLRLDDAEGRPRGLLSWFAVHATNVHNDNRLISADNKGYAAAYCEGDRPGFVATFCQGAAADVSPNYQYFPGKPFPRGKYADDFASARYNGEIQGETAMALLEAASEAPALTPAIDAALMWVDLADVAVDPAYAEGKTGRRTGSAAIGVPMLQGTAEGPGVSEAVAAIAHVASGVFRAQVRLGAALAPPAERERVLAKLRAHGRKALFVEMGEGRVLGSTDVVRLLPGWVDAVIDHIKVHLRQGTIGEKPWTPNILPLQIVILGEVAIAALPGEFTTQAGRRLRATLEGILSARGVRRVILSGYANAYAGYVTTPEEYDLQLYEGASTHFGKWTLGAYQTLFARLARQMLEPPAERRLDTGLRPHRFTPEEIACRAFRKTS